MARTYEISGPKQRGPALRIVVIALVILLIVSARSLASYSIEVQWWKELGQFPTWLTMVFYSLAPKGAAAILAFVVLWVAHARALKFAGTRLQDHRVYAQ